MGGCDLHTHSTASDGWLAPAELVAAAAAAGLEAMAITDHDTVGGLAEGSGTAASRGILFVPGIEISTDLGSSAADILGYFIDPAAPSLHDLTTRIALARADRADRIVAALQGLGLPLERSAVDDVAGGATMGRPHIATALVRAGLSVDAASAFRDYLGRGAPAFVERYHLQPEEACVAIRAAGGVPGLAHPLRTDLPRSDPLRLTRLLPRLVESGLGALECFYPGYTVTMSRRLLALARHFGLVATGGSDFHGSWHPGHELGSATVPLATLGLLRRVAETQ